MISDKGLKALRVQFYYPLYEYAAIDRVFETIEALHFLAAQAQESNMGYSDS